MTRTRTRLALALVTTAALLAGCGGAGTPVEPAPIASVERPRPANVVEGAEPPADPKGEDCNATASLRPEGLGMPPGSTMDKIKERGQLIVGVDQTTYLFGFRNPTSGALEGFDIDIANEVAKAIFGNAWRSHIQYRAISSAQRVDLLKEGTVDIVVRTFSITCARLKDVGFSTVYYTAGQRLLAPKNANVRSMADLAGKRVCATSTSTSSKQIAADPANPVLVTVENWSDCVVLLQQNQVDAISTDDTILAGMAEQDPTTEVVGEPFTVESYGIGVPKQNTDMIKFVNAVLDTVRAGPWQDSYNRWLSESLGAATPPQPNYR
ncbi:glutamate ABC transporter substrate-binding protein [Amycolatopsis magusensis]|uniref:Polar amino acid transport system substrate-binding protein n=1 Tax=Amycolatopsis magusensis TaxID=882444 RepID=A0ABS4PMS0_9PSEU|nr:glutamate ABC transporter substrate-binding protein [Amycolatopsis magusensis]MBP2180159.1 polar amino acid transport system substrate-binding protein [Amycolatopsis magusensis]MDI5981472.1 transporter substrate-binding domain-containing protein [Amycolatopsis magusensis]